MFKNQFIMQKCEKLLSKVTWDIRWNKYFPPLQSHEK